MLVPSLLLAFLDKCWIEGQFIHFFVSLQLSLGLIFIHVDTFKKVGISQLNWYRTRTATLSHEI
jgi:hypothetical protein